MHNFKRPSRARAFPLLLLFVVLALVPPPTNVSAQQRGQQNAPPAAALPALKRATSRHETRRFHYGSTLTLVGAPAGSITIEAWPRSEVDITADVELYANTEEDLALLASVNTFTIDEDINHLRILSTGTHDRAYMKRVAKKFPKRLLGLPWKIDYRLRVPAVCDLEIDAGRGPISLSGVEGSISLKALESDATLTLTGGVVRAVIGAGSVKVNVAARSWRGAGAQVELARGDLSVELPPGFNAEVSADVLRAGQIENAYPDLVPQQRTPFTPRSIRARAGSGGAFLSFRVTDGTLRIGKAVTSEK
ncbi:MAG TPA: hypothetical protein VD861_08220 [Pyrinomonadaceae bacterium]|nr:hypothetical protein [Pyrinomonadaceae bacterium]